MKERNTMKSWKYALAMAILPVSLWAANITGTVTTGTGVGASPVSGALVKLLNGTSTGTLQDDSTTNGAGAYTITNPGSNGQKVLSINVSGYNNYTAAFAYNGAALTENATLVINNNTSTITGTVLASSNSAPIDSAIVTLSGGTLGAPISVYTNTLGQYAFDSVGTGTGYSVSATKSGFSSSSAGSIAAVWNATTTVGTFSLSNNKGKISGTIKSAANGNPIIKTGNSIIFYANTAKPDSFVRVDSVSTDTFGNYSDSLPSNTYTIKISSVGFKSDSDLAALDTSATVSFGATTTLNAVLTTATASLGGTISFETMAGGTTSPLASAKLYLQRRATNFGAGSTTFWTVDSTTTDVNGLYDFVNMIAGTIANYRVEVLYTFNTGSVVDSTNNTTVAAGAAVTLNYTVLKPTSIFGQVAATTGDNSIRFISAGGQLTLEFSPKTMARTVSIFDLSGALQHQVSIPANADRVMVPGAFAPGNGFLFQVK